LTLPPNYVLCRKFAEIDDCCFEVGIGVIRDKFVFAMGGEYILSSNSVSMIDVSSLSPCWVPLADMLVRRKNLRVGVLYDCIIYAVSYTYL
jgi:kelch-like protein 2/3